MKTIEAAGCFGKELGELNEWFSLEIIIFYINLIVLAIYLIHSRMTYHLSAEKNVSTAYKKIVNRLYSRYYINQTKIDELEWTCKASH